MRLLLRLEQRNQAQRYFGTGSLGKNPVHWKQQIATAADFGKRLGDRIISKTLKILSDNKSKYQKMREITKLRTSNYVLELQRMINQATGYEECEKLRTAVKSADESFQKVRNELYLSRTIFDGAIKDRCCCQKEINSLLQRKQSWSDEDLSRFTELYRKEIRLEQNEAEAKQNNERLEGIMDDAHQKLMDSMRERYQEEQLWSDKIRRLSTFGTFSLMGLNLILFLLIQLYIEPRKRRRLMTNFEQVVDEKVATLDRKVSNALEKTALSHPTVIKPSTQLNDLKEREKLIAVIKKNVIVQGALAGIASFLFLSISKSLFQ